MSKNSSISLVCKKWKEFNDIVKEKQLKIVKEYLSIDDKIDEKKIKKILKKCFNPNIS